MAEQPSLFPEMEVEGLLKRLAEQSRNAVPAEAKAADDVPLLVERVQVETEQHGQSYEEANWAKLSPMFRRAHNRLRIQRGLSPIPEPKIDRWVPPAMRKPNLIDPNDKEFVRAARDFIRGSVPMPRMMGGGGEGFTDHGSHVPSWQDP